MLLPNVDLEVWQAVLGRQWPQTRRTSCPSHLATPSHPQPLPSLFVFGHAPLLAFASKAQAWRGDLPSSYPPPLWSVWKLYEAWVTRIGNAELFLERRMLVCLPLVLIHARICYAVHLFLPLAFFYASNLLTHRQVAWIYRRHVPLTPYILYLGFGVFRLCRRAGLESDLFG